jgi:hypothetical protein
VITRDTDNPTDEFATQIMPGTGGAHDEKGIEMAYNALHAEAAPGTPFFRDDARLVVIFISDEEEQSDTVDPWDAAAYFQTIKDPRMVLAHSVTALSGDGCTVESYGTRYAELTSMIGGLRIPICGDWSAIVGDLASASVVKLDRFALSSVAARGHDRGARRRERGDGLDVRRRDERGRVRAGSGRARRRRGGVDQLPGRRLRPVVTTRSGPGPRSRAPSGSPPCDAASTLNVTQWPAAQSKSSTRLPVIGNVTGSTSRIEIPSRPARSPTTSSTSGSVFPVHRHVRTMPSDSSKICGPVVEVESSRCSSHVSAGLVRPVTVSRGSPSTSCR